MDAAAQACRRDPFQAGFLVELPKKGELLVTGDLHGNGGNLRRIVKLANLPRYANRHLVLQELVHQTHGGDDVCRSYRLVETAARLKATFPSQVHLLLGNHEFSELLDLQIGKRGQELNLAFEEGLRAAYADRWKDVKEAYCRFWRTCPLCVRTASRIFVSHSTPRAARMGSLDLDYLRHASPDDVFDRNGPVFAMIWGRDYRPETADEFARRMEADVLIVGHTPCDNGMDVPNHRHIILDCKDMEGQYILLPLDRQLTQDAVLAKARRLYPRLTGSLAGQNPWLNGGPPTR